MIDDRWSANKIRGWHRCARKFHNTYILGLGEASTPDQDFGTVGHAALEDRLTEMMGGNGPAWPRLADPYEQARLDAVLAGYHARWADDAHVYAVLGVEVPFEYELGGHVIQGRMDAILQRRSDGRVLIGEHKFTGSDISAGSTYVEKLALDYQCSIYIDAAAALGYGGDVEVLFDAVARPRHERRLATPEAERTFTKPKGCKACGGKVGGGKVEAVQGSGVMDITDIDGDNAQVQCSSCNGTGWSEPARLHANQRDRDETPEEFFDRIVSDIAARPDDFFTRTTVTRTEAQKERSRSSVLDTIKLARLAEVLDIFPQNDQACFAYNTRCFYWSACNGIDDINDRNRFPLRTKP